MVDEKKMKTTRQYVYDETYNEVMTWARVQKEIGNLKRSPNYKVNFPFYLEQYLDYLKFKR